MSSRNLHPLACRLPRAERMQAVAFARSNGLSNTALLKIALREFLKAQPAVNAGVNKLSDSPVTPALLTPHRLPRQPGSVRASALLRRSARDGERKGLLSDTV
jgi:hypothetical protein